MKFTRKLAVVALAAAMVCSLNIFTGVNNSLIAEAADYGDKMQYDDYLFYKQVDKDEDGIYDYVEITDCDKSAEKVIIPSEIEGLPVMTIGEYAFFDCLELTSVEIPNSVTSIGGGAFCECKGLTSVEIPDGVSSIGDWTFYGCKDLTSVEIPDSVTSIGEYAFYDCVELTSIEIPDSVMSIGYRAFYNCSSLTSVDIPGGVTTIESSTFSFCSSLTSVEIPDSVTTIGDYAFFSCSSLTSINVSENNENYSSIDGVLFNKTQTELIRYPQGKEDENYSIPDSVTSIGDAAFYGCKGLTSVEIPDSVTLIDYCAFYNCSSLTSVTIKNPDCKIFYDSSTICNGCDYKNDDCYYNGIIRGYEGSTAQAYAENWGYKFESLGEAPELMISDIIKLKKFLVKSGELSKSQFKKYDLNNDNKINVFDFIIMKRKLLNN